MRILTDTLAGRVVKAVRQCRGPADRPLRRPDRDPQRPDGLRHQCGSHRAGYPPGPALSAGPGGAVYGGERGNSRQRPPAVPSGSWTLWTAPPIWSTSSGTVRRLWPWRKVGRSASAWFTSPIPGNALPPAGARGPFYTAKSFRNPFAERSPW